jgi:N-acylneuraminate cytidylyltransferase
MSDPKILAIIPARSGSKRIPGKNIKEFLGKPVIAYSIETAIKSGLFNRIMVSTDSLEIAEIAEKHGAEVPFLRSQKNSDDHASLADVIDEVLEAYKLKGNIFSYACCILPAAPLVTVSDLRKGFELLKAKGFSSVRPIVQYSFPVQRSFKLKNKRVEFAFPDDAKKRSQDLEKTYHDAGQFYWIDVSKGLRDPNRGAIVVPETRSQDIDDETDWKLAELKYKLINTR